MEAARIAYISIGDCCQTADQLRRYFGVDNSQFFDWLITPSPCRRSAASVWASISW